MIKKITSMIIVLCLMFTVLPTVFADEYTEIEAGMKTLAKGEKNIKAVNDMSPESFLRDVYLLLPSDTNIVLSYDNSDADFRLYNATSERNGVIQANIKLTCGPYTRHQYLYVTIPKLAGGEIEKNTDGEKLDIPDSKNEKTDVADEPQKTENTQKTEISFDDVASDAYYAQPVKWAVEKGITSGTSSTTFSPDLTCTRAQILTFLWRSVGSPKASVSNPFADISSSDYYYGAALWAFEKGMVTGVNFEGDTPCTRASTVMYMWQNASSPESEDECIFDDVDSDASYVEAVKWATKNGVTSGTSDTTFSPDMICNRGQIVTFLSRAIQ